MTPAERLFGWQCGAAVLVLTVVFSPLFLLFNGVEAAAGGWGALWGAMWRVPGQLYGVGSLIAALSGALVALRWRSTGQAVSVSLYGRTPAYLAVMAGLSVGLVSVPLGGIHEGLRPLTHAEDGWRTGDAGGLAWWQGPATPIAQAVALHEGRLVGRAAVRSGVARGWSWTPEGPVALNQRLADLRPLPGPGVSSRALIREGRGRWLWSRIGWPLWCGGWAMGAVALSLWRGRYGGGLAVVACGLAQLAQTQGLRAAAAGQQSFVGVLALWMLVCAGLFAAVLMLHQRGISPRG